MPRLPKPGGDVGNWGEILNEYLRQSHNADGSISQIDGGLTKLQLRRGTVAQWISDNPTLAEGEVGLETDTGKRKIGDGVHAWTALAYDSAVPAGLPGQAIAFGLHGPLMSDREFDVRSFGAIGDGASHSLSERYATLVEAQAVYPHATALTDEIDWAAIQAAVLAAEAAGGGTIHFPRGAYQVNRSIVSIGAKITWDDLSYGGIVFRGEGMRASRLIGSPGIHVLKIGTTGSKIGYRFSEFAVVGSGKASAGSVGIDSWTIGGGYVFDDMLVEDFEIGVRFYDNTLVEASHLNVRNCGTGIALGRYADAQTYHTCRIDNCDIGVHIGYANVDRGETVGAVEVHGVEFIACLMNLNGVAAYIQGSPTECITFSSCYMEQYSDVAMRIGDAAFAKTVSAAVIIDNCYFNGNRLVAPVGVAEHAIEVNYAPNVSIRGGGYRFHSETPIHLRHNSGSACQITEPGNYAPSGGVKGVAKLPDNSYVTIGRFTPLALQRRSAATVSVASSLATATAEWVGSVVQVAGVTYECGADGSGGYAWYARPTAKAVGKLASGLGQAANPDTSGATLADLETEVNQLKAALRTAGILVS